MPHSTDKTWPEETAEDVVERTRREHGDAAAEVVARAIGAPPTRRRPPPTRVGVKAKVPPAMPRRPRRMSREDAVEVFGDRWAERLELERRLKQVRAGEARLKRDR